MFIKGIMWSNFFIEQENQSTFEITSFVKKNLTQSNEKYIFHD